MIEHLLGAPRGVTVIVDGTSYVLPRGFDAYWADFGHLYGYELLPPEERPIQVGPTRDIWRPGSPRPGFVEGRRKTWTNLPPP
ncbi:MAG: hypothetical protein M5U28_14180 [Sandaracinaceae bacterium]|nr:hypothetical protein [Sandaracinaceae bacterium]